MTEETHAWGKGTEEAGGDEQLTKTFSMRTASRQRRLLTTRSSAAATSPTTISIASAAAAAAAVAHARQGVSILRTYVYM